MKQYYSISEVSRLVKESLPTLRHWEATFQDLTPRTNRRGKRMYSPQNIAFINQIKQLVREQGYTLAGAEAFIKNKQTVSSTEEAIKKLTKIKAFLVEIKEQLPDEETTEQENKPIAQNAANTETTAAGQVSNNNGPQ